MGGIITNNMLAGSQNSESLLQNGVEKHFNYGFYLVMSISGGNRFLSCLPTHLLACVCVCAKCIVQFPRENHLFVAE